MDTERQIILLAGAKQHGKDTFALALTDNHAYVRFAFADALKKCAAAALGVNVSVFHDNARKEEPIPGYPHQTYRGFLENLGTEYFREKFPGIWPNTVVSLIRASHCEHAVISDCRFDDEIKRMLQAFPLARQKVVTVIRPDAKPEPTDGMLRSFEQMRAEAIAYAAANGTKLVPCDKLDVEFPSNAELTKFRTDAAEVAHVSAWNYRLFLPDFVLVNNGTFADMSAAAAQLNTHMGN